MKTAFKRICDHVFWDRILILFVFISLLSSIFLIGLVRQVSIGVCIILIVVLLFRLLRYSWKNKAKRNTNCRREKDIKKILLELTNKKNVILHPIKFFEIIPDLQGANSLPRPFLAGMRVHYGGIVRIGCSILCCIDNLVLRGILAHEVAHIQKKHTLRALLPFIVLLPVIIIVFVSASSTLISILLAIPIGILIYSFISWHDEYEADAIASECIGNKDMVNSLQQYAKLIYRPGDTLMHPSFRKRISRLLLDK